MAQQRTLGWLWIWMMGAIGIVSCGSSTDGGVDGRSPSTGSGGTSGGGTAVSGSGSSANASSVTPSSGAIVATPIPGGGDLSAPLGVGCGPETAHDCFPAGGDCDISTFGSYELISAARECFFAVDAQVPTATIEHVLETRDGEEYVHIRVTFNPAFADTVYGDCASQTGWTGKGHTFRDLLGSDHVELMLFDCSDELTMQMKVDFIQDQALSACGYASAGVDGGDGKMIVGDPSYVLAASSSLDRNMNGCGYCDDEVSPCTDIFYGSDPEAPNWDFRVSYEVWVAAEAFGSVGFCRAHMESVHASPSKTGENRIDVIPDDCGTGGAGGGGSGGGGGVSSCPTGYVNQVDLLSEDVRCVPE